MSLTASLSSWEEAEAPWRDLYSRSERATPFQSFDWCYEFWRARLLAGEPHILLFRDADRTVGIVPLCRLGTGMQMKRLLLMGGDYNDLLSELGSERAVVGALLQHLQANRRSWDMADLRSLRHDSALLAGLPEATGFLAARIDHQNYPVLDLPRTWEEMLSSLSKSMRTDLKQSPRKMEKDFSPVELRRTTAETFEEDMNVLFELHQDRWQSKGQGGIFAEGHVRDFHRKVAEAFLSHGELMLYTLRLEGNAAGVAYCLAHASEVAYYLGGFDRSLSKYNPQKVALGDAIKGAIGLGLKTMDFLKGEEDYKWRWGAKPRLTYRVVLAPKKLKSWVSMSGLKLQPWAKGLRKKLKAR